MMTVFPKWKGPDRETIKIILLLLHIHVTRSASINRYERGHRFCTYGDHMPQVFWERNIMSCVPICIVIPAGHVSQILAEKMWPPWLTYTDTVKLKQCHEWCVWPHNCVLCVCVGGVVDRKWGIRSNSRVRRWKERVSPNYRRMWKSQQCIL